VSQNCKSSWVVGLDGKPGGVVEGGRPGGVVEADGYSGEVPELPAEPSGARLMLAVVQEL
jgi:hypothetical protein